MAIISWAAAMTARSSAGLHSSRLSHLLCRLSLAVPWPAGNKGQCCFMKVNTSGGYLWSPENQSSPVGPFYYVLFFSPLGSREPLWWILSNGLLMDELRCSEWWEDMSDWYLSTRKQQQQSAAAGPSAGPHGFSFSWTSGKEPAEISLSLEVTGQRSGVTCSPTIWFRLHVWLEWLARISHWA